MPVRILDSSFLYFQPSLQLVYDRLNDPDQFDPQLSKRMVQIHTSDTTRQVTNSDFPLAFGMDYKAELVTKCGVVLADVTGNVFMEQFVNSQTGIINQYIEIIQLPTAYTMPVHLKISHWAADVPLSNLVAYSNPFYISASTAGTSVVTYWDTGVRFGIDYATTGAICRIRIRGSFRELDDATTNETYTQVSAQDGNGIVIEKHSDDLIFTKKYLVEYTDNHGIKCFGYFRKHGVKYINGIRATSITQESAELLGSSNFRVSNWTVNFNESEYYVDSFQIAPNMALVIGSLIPFGVYTAAGFPTTLQGSFNVPITLGTGTLSIYSPVLGRLGNFTEADITVVGNTFTINIAPLGLGIGNYYVNFTGKTPTSDGLFVSVFGQTVALSDNTTWPFEISEADYLNADYADNDYFDS